MKLNFYMEISGFIVCLLLSIITCARYNLIDLKDRIYVRMVRMSTAFFGMNILSFFIIHYNILQLKNVAYAGIYLSFWYMVWILYYMNLYLDESVFRKNHIPIISYLIYGLPAFVNLILLIINVANHCVFDLTVVESRMTVFFHLLYVLPYVLVIISLMIYVVRLFHYRLFLAESEQMFFYLIPVMFVFAYYIQFRFKAVATFGFSCAIILLLIYLFSYNYNEKMDHLTNLPNEHSFIKMLEYRIGNGKQMFVVMLSLNDFKYVNREYGYKNGNLFIKSVANYLEGISNKNCIARLEGDRFGVVLDNTTYEDVKQWMNKVIERFEEPWNLNKIHCKLSVSIAAVSFPDMGENREQIQELLIFLNQQAKLKRHSYGIICDNELKNKMHRKVKIASMLKEVIQAGNMFVEYQPIYDATNNAYTKAEALFRLKDSLLGDISPAEFFPIAEEQGYVVDIGYVLIDKVCNYIQRLKEQNLNVPVISVNFSRQQLMADHLCDELQTILSRYNLTADSIAIEIQEQVFSLQYEKVKNRMLELSQQGFRFYLDGFGTGFLDLTHLMELPFELIKINKNMIREAAENDTIFLLVSAMTAVFEEKGIQILGDGIESDKHKGASDMLFMDYLQGYFFSEPVVEEKATEMFQSKNVMSLESDSEAVDAILASMAEMDDLS